jgi:hypothetical protein
MTVEQVFTIGVIAVLATAAIYLGPLNWTGAVKTSSFSVASKSAGSVDDPCVASGDNPGCNPQPHRNRGAR